MLFGSRRVLFFLISLIVCVSCTTKGDEPFIVADNEGTSLKSEKLFDYPKQIDSLCRTELEARLNNEIELISIEVFHRAILQTEPVRKEFIDRNNYFVTVFTLNSSSKKGRYSLLFNKQLKCYSVSRVTSKGVFPVE